MNKKVKLLIITQKVDENDDVLGFFHRWIEEFAKHCEQVTVICLYEGEHHLPENVKVLSLGKEKYIRKRCDLKGGVTPTRSLRRSEATEKVQVGVTPQLLTRIKYILRFYKYIWQERKNYDDVFVHMNQVYVILGGFFWRLLGKRVGLWYAHGHVSFSLRIAVKLAHTIFTSTKSGLRLESKKIKIVGQGIDVDKFSIESRKLSRSGNFKIITVGRISPVKDYETLVNSVDILIKKGMTPGVSIIGDAETPQQKEYLFCIKNIIKEKNLGSFFTFLGSVSNKDLPQYLQRADIFVSMSHTGSLDKAVLEAMSVGLPILTCNEALVDVLGVYGDKLIFPKKSSEILVEKIKFIISTEHTERVFLGRNLREIVKKDHNLSNFIKKIVKGYVF